MTTNTVEATLSVLLLEKVNKTVTIKIIKYHTIKKSDVKL